MKEVYLSCMRGLKGQNQGVFRVRISNFPNGVWFERRRMATVQGSSIEARVQGLHLRHVRGAGCVWQSGAADAGNRSTPRGAEALRRFV